MKAVWLDLEQKLRTFSPELHQDLNSPATAEEILDLETIIGSRLPLDFIECLQIHNGQKGNTIGLFDGLEFMSCQRIVAEWQIWKQLLENHEFDDLISNPDPAIKTDWWNPLWIPFTYDGSGNHLCIDLMPSNTGIFGQIISIYHDDATRKKVADNFTQWISAFTESISR